MRAGPVSSCFLPQTRSSSSSPGVNLLVDSGFTAAMVTGQADFSGLA